MDDSCCCVQFCDSLLESLQKNTGKTPDELTARIQDAVRAAMRSRGFQTGSINVRVCGDDEIRGVNAAVLQHDYATDVISFPYAMTPPHVEGELISSWETAVRVVERSSRDNATHDTAARSEWTPLNELLLYVIHGSLHICGMDDQTPAQRREMRVAEFESLAAMGISQPTDWDADQIPTEEA